MRASRLWSAMPGSPLVVAMVTTLFGSMGATAAQEWESLPDAQCRRASAALNERLRIASEVGSAAFSSGAVAGRSCRISWSGDGLQVEGASEVVDAVVAGLRGWEGDLAFDADGPTGMSRGFRKGGNLVVVSVEWAPPVGRCAEDAPISDCGLTATERIWTVTIDALRRR